jgi:hypothetical protein
VPLFFARREAASAGHLPPVFDLEQQIDAAPAHKQITNAAPEVSERSNTGTSGALRLDDLRLVGVNACVRPHAATIARSLARRNFKIARHSRRR